MNPTMPKKPCNQHSLWLRKGFAAFAFLVGFAMLTFAPHAGAQVVPATVTVSVDNSTIAEAAGTSTLTVSFSEPILDNEIVFPLILAGTATETDDFTIGSKSLTLLPGESSVSTTVTAVQDTIDETDETILITVRQPFLLGFIDLGTQQTITITDDDPAMLSGSLTNTSLQETAGSFSLLTFSTTPGTFETDQIITLTVAGSATKDKDYLIAHESLTLRAGQSQIVTSLSVKEDIIDEGDEEILIRATLNRVENVIGTWTLTIEDDDDAPTLSVSVDPASIAEAAGTSTLTVSTGSGSTFDTDQTIILTLAGTATEDVDYTIDSKSLTLPAGVGTTASSVSTDISAVQDIIFESNNETVLITASRNGSTIGARQTVTITGDDNPPSLSVSVDPASIAEAAGTSTLTVSTDTTTFATDQTFGLTLAGTATKDTDYTISAESLTLKAGETSVTAVVTAVQDIIDDDAETVRINVSHRGGIFSRNTITITDDDATPTLSVAVDNATIAEAAGTSTLTVSTGATAFASDQTITLALAGTATKDTDYTISAESLTLAAGATSVTATVTAVQDIIDEPNERVRITASHNSTTIGLRQTITIADDDAAPTFRPAASVSIIAEAAGTSTLTVKLSEGSTVFATDQTITLSLAGTATKDTDYTISAESLTLAAEATSVTAVVTAVQDSIDEPNETVLITASHNGSTIGSQRTVTIADDDAAPTFRSHALSSTSIAEAAGTSTLTVQLSEGSTIFATDQTIDLELAGTATKDDDYTISAESLTLTAGETSVTAMVTAVSDVFDEANETVLITVSHNSSAIGSQQTVTITDDDAAPALSSVSVSSAAIVEDGGTSTLTVSTNGSAFTSDRTITLALAGTATKDTDYTISAESLTLAAGETSVTAVVTAVQDTIVETNETVLITASHNSTTIGARQTISIADDDGATFTVSVNNATIAEAAGTSTVTVSTGTTFATDQTITLTLAGTATEDDDFTIGSKSLTLTAGETSVTTTVTAVQDIIDDDSETVLITASHNSITIGARQTITITDDDDAPTLSVAVDNATIAEAAGTSTLTVSTGATAFAADQTIALALAGTATKDDDFTITPETVTLKAGETSATATVTAVQDVFDEANETVLITASHNSSTIGSRQTVTITDDDAAPALSSVSVSNAAIVEDRGASTLTVSTNGSGFTGDQTITLTLAGTATKDTDYTISAETLTLKAGETSVTAVVTAVQDIIVEANETVLITASHNSTTIGARQTITIADDDGATFTVSVNNATIAEAAGASTLTVSVSGTTFAADQTITLTLAGTATETTDFTVGSKSLTLTAGETSVTTTVTAVQDIIDDDAETVLITASHNSATIGARQTITITDDDAAPTLSVAVDNTTIDEAAGTSTLTVSTGATAFAADRTIALALAGTATKTSDYTISAESLTLVAGTTSVTATVTAVSDVFDEANETVLITASHNSSTIGSRQTVTITDDDAAPVLSSFSVNKAAIAEDGGTFMLTVSTNGSGFTSDQTITLALAGTATKDTDYTISAESLTLKAGETSVTATVTAVQDAIDEPDETVLITATHNSSTIGAQQTVTITDDDAAPTGLTATASGNTTINLSWTAPVDNSGRAITGYKIEVSSDGGSSFTDQVADTNNAATTYAHTGLRPGTTRHYRVSAITASGTGIPSDVASATTGTTDDCAGGTTTTCSVSPAEAPGSAVTGDLEVIGDADWFRFSVISGVVYEIEVEGAGGLVPKGTLPNPYLELRDATTVIASDDDAGAGLSSRLVWTADRTGTVYARITSSTASGTGTYTLTVTLTATPPDAITDLAAAAGDGQVTLSWSVPGDGGAAITGFSYRQKTSGSYGDWIVISGTGRTTARHTVTGLTNGTAYTFQVMAVNNRGNGGASNEATATPSSVPALSIAVDPASIAEAAGTSTVTVSAGRAFTTDQTIALTLGGTATETSDYTLSDTSLTLTAGETSVTTTVTAVQDTIDESNETVIVSAANGGTAIGSATVTITDDDDAPTLSVSVDNATIAEAAGTSTLTVSTGAATFATDQSISLTLAGTAAKTDDYTISAESLTLKAGESSVTATVTAVQDKIDEANETILITATHDSATVGSQQTVTVTDDDDAPVLTLQATRPWIHEQRDVVRIVVSTGAGSTFASDQTITLALAGTATEDHDYSIGSKSLTLPAGVGTTVTRAWTDITSISDRVDDDDETILITATHDSATVGSRQTVTIRDTNARPVLSLAVSPATIAEAAGRSTVTVSTGRGSTFATDQTITLTLSGSATENDDYTIVSKSLTLPAEASSVTTRITAVQDRMDEADETVRVNASHNGGNVGSRQTVTITDDDPAPALSSVSLNNAAIAEAGGTSTVTVSTNGSIFTSDQTITLALAGTATKDIDYTISAESLTLKAGETSVTATVTAVQDIIDDDAETVLITASHNSSTIGAQQTVTITDDDGEATFTVSVNNATIAEAAGTSTLTVSTGGTTFATDQTITLTLAGTATEDDDYTIGSKSLTLTAGETSATTTVTAVQDIIDDDAETVLITASHNSSTIGAQQTVTITDDDATPTLAFTISLATLPEAGEVPVTLTISTSGTAFEDDREINFDIGAASTADVVDYDFGPEGFILGLDTLTLMAGTTSVTIKVKAIDDLFDDDDETIVITAQEFRNATLTDIATHTLTITDNDDAPALSSASVSNATIAEAAGTSTLTVSTNGSAFATDRTITLALAGTATKTSDYTISAESLTLKAGESSVTATVTAVQDNIAESSETVLITASHNSSTIGAQQTVTITDDDTTPTLSVAVNNATIAEAGGTSTVTVSTGAATFATDQSISLALAGTAAETDDYTISADSLTLKAGESSVTATVTAVQDRIDEANETILITTTHDSATVGSQQTVTVTDDDAAPVLSLLATRSGSRSRRRRALPRLR